MRSRRMPRPAFINALYITDGCHKDWMVVRVLFPCKNPSFPHYDRSVFRDLRPYDELVLSTKAWKMHTPLIKIVVNNDIVMLIELASNSARYTGGKLAIGCHPVTCPISKSGTYRWTSRDTESSVRATSSCMRLVQSITYNLYKGTMGLLVTWQELWMLMGLGFGMVSFGLGRGQEGLISSNIGVYRHL